MLTKYIETAMAHAQFEFMDEDQEYFGNIPPCRGVYATGANVEACREELQSVLEGWILVHIQRGRDVPAVDGVSLVAEQHV